MYAMLVIILNLKGFVATKVGFWVVWRLAGCDEKSTFNGECQCDENRLFNGVAKAGAMKIDFCKLIRHFKPVR